MIGLLQVPSLKAKRREREKETVRKQRESSISRKKLSDYYLSDGEGDDDNNNSCDDGGNSDGDGKNKRKKRKKGKRDRKFTDTINAPIQRDDKSLGLTVGSRKKRNNRRKSNKQFTVIRCVETVAGIEKKSTKSKREKQLQAILKDDLAADMDFSQATDAIMPTLKPYKQDSSSMDLVFRSHILKDENENNEQNEKKRDKTKKVMCPQFIVFCFFVLRKKRLLLCFFMFCYALTCRLFF